MTEREKQILFLVHHGYKNNEIASKLHVSSNTVKAHITAMMRKMNAKNRAHLVYLALKDRLITI